MKIFCFFVLIFLSVGAFSQTNTDSVSTAIVRSFSFDGVIKTKLETSTEEGVIRFNVRNSRVGVRGDISEHLSFRAQVEFSNEGVFSPLDFFGILKPTKNFSFLFGQQLIPFDNSYIISPAEMMFANRAFVGKYFTPGTRDIGAVAQYRFRIGDLPMEGQAGTFNGNRINVPQWTDNPSYAFRLLAGNMNGIRATAKLYKYNGEHRNELFLGADFRYANSRLRVETEIMNRHSNITGLDLFGTLIQGAYKFLLHNANIFQSLTPAIRWDAMGYDMWNFNVNRFTAGVQFGITNSSLIRIDYEHFFMRKGLVFPDFDNRDKHVSDNKITIELLVKL